MIARLRAAMGRDSGASVIEYGLLLVAVTGIVVGMALLLYRSIDSAGHHEPCSTSTSTSC